MTNPKSESAGEQRFRLVVEAAPNAMVMLDRAGKIVLVNIQAERVFGYSRAELEGQPVEMLVPERFRGHHPELRTTFFADPRPRPMGAGRELYGLKKDGSEFPVEIGLSPIETDEGIMVLSAIVDITARKAAELALRESEQRYSLLVDGVTDYAIYMLDPHGIVTNWNRGAERIKGYRTEEIVGQHFSRFFTEEDRAANVPQHSLEIAARDGRYEAEAWRVRKDGSRFLANAVIDALRDDRGQLIGFGKITRDITERVQAARAVEEARIGLVKARAEEAVQKLQAELAHATRVTTLGELAASIAHEINQPLAAIVGDADACLDWLDDVPPDLARVREGLTAIVEDGKRAAAVIARIRTLLSGSPVAQRPCDLAGVIGDVLVLVRPEVERHGIALQTDVATELPPVLSDRIQLQQVLLNLLMNAVDASAEVPPERRRLLVRAAVEHRDGSPSVLVAVRDAGVGFLEPQAPRLFEAFYTTKPGGLGMGLSISRSIIEGHGGRLWATANPDHGATFHFLLPAIR